MNFEFATATRILFGPGILMDALRESLAMGERVFLITGRSRERASGVRDLLEREKRFGADFRIVGEPTVSSVSEAVRTARDAGCDMVVGIGGGSVIDAGKAVAAMLANPEALFEYLEVIGEGRQTQRPSAPYVAVPTTAGTGAEVTRNAVIGSEEHGVKVSMRSPLMLPRLAVVDPELTLSLPPETTASTGLDALTQLIEAFTSKGANPLTDSLCREGLFRAARSLRQACTAGHDLAARQDMAVASLFSGMALANAKLGAVHGIAAPMGGLLSAPHGAVCASLLPHVVEANVCALRERAPASPFLKRYDELARILTGKTDATAQDGVFWIKRLCATLRTRPAGELGLTPEQFAAIAEKSRKASSMKGNPVELSQEELVGILGKALN